MSEQQNTTGTAPEQQQERTFTQEQVNAIVGKRLAEARSSQEADLNRRETELNQRETQIRAKELLAERGLPKELADVLKYTDEDSLVSALNVIERTKVFKKNKPNNGIIIEPNPLPSRSDSDIIGNSFRKAMGLDE